MLDAEITLYFDTTLLPANVINFIYIFDIFVLSKANEAWKDIPTQSYHLFAYTFIAKPKSYPWITSQSTNTRMCQENGSLKIFALVQNFGQAEKDYL